MKTYTFNLDNNTSFKNNTFHTWKDYSKDLDNLIHADIMEKNYYLNSDNSTTGDIYLDKMIGINNDGIIIGSTGLKDADAFAKAADFLANYSKPKSLKISLPYEYGKTYKLSDGTPIIFFDDSIQIGFDLYYFDDFKKKNFLSNLTAGLKKTIISIYTNGLKISIIK